jgi:poly-gamma-glutamate synthesis protein (capsule biosynthesis protein)
MGPESKRTLMIAGDVAPFNWPEKLLAAGRVTEVFEHIGDVFKSADAVIANLEGPLTASNIKRSKAGPNLKALPEVGPAFAAAGISTVSLANNHIFDYGLAGLEQTRSVLDDNGIAYSGVRENAATASAPLYLDLGGFTLGMLSYAEHEFNWTLVYGHAGTCGERFADSANSAAMRCPGCAAACRS